MKKIVFLVVMLFFISCIKETVVSKKTIIVNKSGYPISFTAYYHHQDIVIKLKDLEQASETREHIGGVETFPMESDSVIIVFNNTHIAKYYNNSASRSSDRSLYNEDVYKKESLGEKKNYFRYIYTYTITKEDYNNASPIKKVEK